MKNLSYNNLNNETILCLSCAGENDANSGFCRYCNTLLALTNNSDPLPQLVTEGDLYSKAAEGKPKLIVLIGIWVIFLIPLIFGAVSAFSIIAGGGGGGDTFIFYLFSIVTFFFSFVMIYKVTKNYFKKTDK
jgi:hypothetical protein